MEIQRLVDFNALPWYRLCPFLRYELGPMVRRLLCSHSILHFGGTFGSVVLCLRSFDLRRRVLWLPKTRNRTSSANEPDSTSDSRAKYLHAADSWHRHGWCFALWMYFHTALFRPQLHLVIADLLHVWIPILGFCHLDHYLLGDDYSALLFPPLR